jgi:hypothetical protein
MYGWIGRATATDLSLRNWPPRSPDLTPCEFYLWRHVDMQELDFRLDVCRVTRGAHIECL